MGRVFLSTLLVNVLVAKLRLAEKKFFAKCEDKPMQADVIQAPPPRRHRAPKVTVLVLPLFVCAEERDSVGIHSHLHYLTSVSCWPDDMGRAGPVIPIST